MQLSVRAGDDDGFVRDLRPGGCGLCGLGVRLSSERRGLPVSLIGEISGQPEVSKVSTVVSRLGPADDDTRLFDGIGGSDTYLLLLAFSWAKSAGG